MSHYERKAPAGMFRAHCTDTFDGTDWVKDYPTQAEATEYVNKTGGTMLIAEVYDDQGRRLHRTGKH